MADFRLETQNKEKVFFIRISPLLSLSGLGYAHVFPARRLHRGSLIEAEDGCSPGPAVPKLLFDVSEGRHGPHLLDDANLDDEVDALGGGDAHIPHRHLLGDALEGVAG